MATQDVQEFEYPKAEIVKANGAAVQSVPAVSPMDLLQYAMQHKENVPVETMERMLTLHERWEANEAKKAYDSAMVALKAEIPEISKNKHVKFPTSKGVTEYDHTTLDHLCDSVIPVMSKHGFSHRWKVAQETGLIRVTCVITHVKGHAEDTTMSAGPDDSGGKNAIQQIASSTHYLERYTLFGGLGIAPKGADDDGSAAGTKMGNLESLLADIVGAGTSDELRTKFATAYKAAMEAGDPVALKRLSAAKEARKKALEAEHAKPAA